MIGLTDKNAVRYEKRIFAFVDLLGFAELVEDSEHDTTKILRIYRLLDRAKLMAQLPVSYEFEYLQVELAKFRSHIFSEAETGVVFPSYRDETRRPDTTDNYILPQLPTLTESD